jgi:hypothetical protein
MSLYHEMSSLSITCTNPPLLSLPPLSAIILHPLHPKTSPPQLHECAVMNCNFHSAKNEMSVVKLQVLMAVF